LPQVIFSACFFEMLFKTTDRDVNHWWIEWSKKRWENSEQTASGMVKSEVLVTSFYSLESACLHKRLLIC